MSKTNYPDELICPITNKNMMKPYICVDGNTYDCINILKLTKSPLTQQQLNKKDFRPNKIFLLFIELYRLNNFNWYLNPKFYYCPITKEIINEPVVYIDGKTYEKNAIINLHNSKYPNHQIEPNTLYPNLVLKKFIERFKQTNLNIDMSDEHKYIFDIDYKYEPIIDEEKYSDIIIFKIMEFNNLIKKYLEHNYKCDYKFNDKYMIYYEKGF